MLCPPGCCGQDGRAPNRFCKAKGPAAVTPPPHQGSRVMRADGSWFHLTSAPPEAGNLASVQDHFFLWMLRTGGAFCDADPAAEKEEVAAPGRSTFKKLLGCGRLRQCKHDMADLGPPRGVLCEIV